MDFAGEPAARTAKCLKLHPACCAGGAAMRPDRGAVDHLQRVQFTAAIGQPLQQHIPYARLDTSGGTAARSNSSCRTPPAGRAKVRRSA